MTGALTPLEVMRAALEHGTPRAPNSILHRIEQMGYTIVPSDARADTAALAQPAPALDVEGWLDEMRYDGTARDPWQRGWNAALSAAKHAIKENR